jgi:hypothetical protein
VLQNEMRQHLEAALLMYEGLGSPSPLEASTLMLAALWAM